LRTVARVWSAAFVIRTSAPKTPDPEKGRSLSDPRPARTFTRVTVVRIGKAKCAPRVRRRRPLAAVVPVLKALSDETRLAIVELLLGSDEELCACDIEAQFDLAQPTISHHLRVLRESGLIETERRGQWLYCAPTRAAREALEALLRAVE
jgi:ArsR family transcriptional regulator, arsenate/arsenite/antimonite-responsive transcriptional repressor